MSYFATELVVRKRAAGNGNPAHYDCTLLNLTEKFDLAWMFSLVSPRSLKFRDVHTRLPIFKGLDGITMQLQEKEKAQCFQQISFTKAISCLGNCNSGFSAANWFLEEAVCSWAIYNKQRYWKLRVDVKTGDWGRQRSVVCFAPNVPTKGWCGVDERVCPSWRFRHDALWRCFCKIHCDVSTDRAGVLQLYDGPRNLLLGQTNPAQNINVYTFHGMKRQFWHPSSTLPRKYALRGTRTDAQRVYYKES